MNYCLHCQKEHKDANWKYVNGGWICSKAFKPSRMPEFVPERLLDDRKEYFNSAVQPYRQGELSKEYLETYGDRGVNASEEEKAKAKYVYKDLPGWETRERAK